MKRHLIQLNYLQSSATLAVLGVLAVNPMIAGLNVGLSFCNGIRRGRVYESRPVGLTRHLKLKIDKGKSNVNANNQRTAARSRLG